MTALHEEISDILIEIQHAWAMGNTAIVEWLESCNNIYPNWACENTLTHSIQKAIVFFSK